MGCTELIKARTSFVMFKLSRALSDNEQKEEVGVKYWGLIERKIGEWRSFCIMVMEQMEYSSFHHICFVCMCVCVCVCVLGLAVVCSRRYSHGGGGENAERLSYGKKRCCSKSDSPFWAWPYLGLRNRGVLKFSLNGLD